MAFDYELYEEVVENNNPTDGWTLIETIGPDYDPQWDGQDLMSCDTVFTYILSNDGKFYRLAVNNNSWEGTILSDPVEVKSYEVMEIKWLTDGEAEKLPQGAN